MSLDDIIPSFGDFIVYCKESDIDKELAIEMMFELLDNSAKYTDEEIIKEYLVEVLPIHNYIQLKSRLF